MKKIIHVDMDCFYAQVEMRDNPQLKNVPLAVGGLPGTRSVLCTSNYLARKFGVKSAMPTDYAVKLCPGLIVVPPNFKKYSKASQIIHSVFQKYSNAIEPVSLDEAYLDVSHYPSATEIAQKIKKDIFIQTGLTASVGVAPNKFLAKIASDWKKPDGLFVITPTSVSKFMEDLPVKLIPGVGKKSLEILASLNISTCSDLREISKDVLSPYFGKFADDLLLYAQGIDERNVQTEWERKSLSVETTFLEDIHQENLLQLEMQDLFQDMKNRLDNFFKEEGEKQIKKIFVKVKFKDFTRSTCEETLSFENENKRPELLIEQFFPLLTHCLAKHDMAVRLIGLGVRFKTVDESLPIQLSLFSYCA